MDFLFPIWRLAKGGVLSLAGMLGINMAFPTGCTIIGIEPLFGIAGVASLSVGSYMIVTAITWSIAVGIAIRQLANRGYWWVSIDEAFQLIGFVGVRGNVGTLPMRDDAAAIPGYRDNVESLVRLILLRKHGQALEVSATSDRDPQESL